MSDFDWRNETTLKGTVSRLGQYVRGDCAAGGCDERDVLVYDTYDDPELLCAGHERKRAAANPRVETCDECGASHAWRDPMSKGNEFYCATCHGKNGTVFQNRWAKAPRVLNKGRAKCYLAGMGTDCKGEVKPRGGVHKQQQVCNKHAGVKSSNEANN